MIIILVKRSPDNRLDPQNLKKSRRNHLPMKMFRLAFARKIVARGRYAASVEKLLFIRCQSRKLGYEMEPSLKLGRSWYKTTKRDRHSDMATG